MSSLNELQLSAFSCRNKISSFIDSGDISIAVLNELLPGGEPFLYEKQLWDYKISLPTLPLNYKPNDAMKIIYGCSMAEIIKDAVSFYNSYGGYLVIGIKDKPREIVGFDKIFDCDELNKRIFTATKHEVDCHFILRDFNLNNQIIKIGLLFIPKRPDSTLPAQFLRNAPETETGNKAYKTHDIYFRQGSECKPAVSSDDYSFLCSQGRRQFTHIKDVPFIPVLDNNLGPRDPGLIRFIGREKYLQRLWRWLCDRYSPCKLLAGLGGVGKTSIAREFTEEITKNCPFGFERVVWLSAKKQFFTAILGKYQPTTRVDFTDTDTLLKAILLEVGWPENQIDAEWTREELIDEIIETLTEIPVFLVIDDVDSLKPQDQIDAFQTISLVMSQTIHRAKYISRAILTARLDLGAAPSQIIPVKGYEFNEFVEYVKMSSKSIGLSLNMKPKSKYKKFYKVTDGSPIFASSILRLLVTGDSLESALDKWKGSSGEEVRRFSFTKELENLNESQLRTLYAACILGETSFVELKRITQSSDTLLEDDIGELRKYHMLALGSQIPRGGTRLIIPSGIRLMNDIIKGRIRDPNSIEIECAKTRAGAPKLDLDAPMIVHRIVALWKENQPKEALEVAKWASATYRDNPDIKCLLGRSFMRLNPPNARKADAEFAKAHRLGCRRPELMDLWIEAKTLIGDWIGVIEVTKLADQISPSSGNIYIRAKAYIELGESAKETGDMPKALDYYHIGGKMVNEAFSKGWARGRVAELKELRFMLYQSYVRMKNMVTQDANEYIEIWLAVMEAFDAYVRSPLLLQVGMERLESWWNAVQQRDRYDLKASNLMGVQIDKLDKIINTLNNQAYPDTLLLQLLITKRKDFNRLLKAYTDEHIRSESI